MNLTKIILSIYFYFNIHFGSSSTETERSNSHYFSVIPCTNCLVFPVRMFLFLEDINQDTGFAHCFPGRPKKILALHQDR